MKNNYESVIGLEVHAQLLTKSKAFCSCSTEFGTIPNANVCPICLGLPGVLPVLNKQVVEFTIRMGLATNCSITEKSILREKLFLSRFAKRISNISVRRTNLPKWIY